MIIVPGDKIAYIDCDDTLVFWDATQEEKFAFGVVFKYPDSDKSELLFPNYPQIEHLKKLKLRHHTIVVWSAGGVAWAETVVRRLGLEDVVDAVICKPTYVFDDLPVQEFMPASRLIKE